MGIVRGSKRNVLLQPRSLPMHTYQSKFPIRHFPAEDGFLLGTDKGDKGT
jgi:hypothetical protein